MASHATPVYRATRVSALSASSTTMKTMNAMAIQAVAEPPGTAYSRGPCEAAAASFFSARRMAK